ncbi:MAG: chromate efflux transporter [Desulfarculus sp.]|nr:chromate efflux transporter [Desulfarculus sp.]
MLGANNLGGKTAVMHRLLVEERCWVTESRFLHALNYCMLLPGPEAMQLAVYLGWMLNGVLGGLAAGVLFVLPGFLSILALSVFYALYQGTDLVAALFFGLKPAVMAVVVEALLRIGKRTLQNSTMVALAAASFVAIFFFDAPFPLIILAAALIGLLGGRRWPQRFHLAKPNTEQLFDCVGPVILSDEFVKGQRPSLARGLGVAVLWLTLWLTPVLWLGLALGWDNTFAQIGAFFSKAAAVTFGGAYAVLAYIAQQAVETYGWLKPGEMLDGLGMAETTPGPLIQVVQFVGFLGAFRHPGTLDPLLAGVLGSVLTTWVTYTPCFLWIFLGGPYIEYLRGHKSLSMALSAITAAVVGVVFNLAIWFALNTLFGKVEEVHHLGVRLLLPVWPTLSWASALIAAGAFLALLRFKLGMVITLAGSVAAGVAVHWMAGS